jgi:hypothetical protein
MWSSLEVAQLVVSAVTPVVVVGLGVVVSRAARRLEQADWANRVLIQRRLDLYDDMAPLFNDLYCFFRFVGHFREIDPPGAIERKRKLDRIFYINRFLLTDEATGHYLEFMNSCFRTYTGTGQNVKLRGVPIQHSRQRGDWDTAWDTHFVADASQAVSPGTVAVRYEAVMRSFASGIGVGYSSAGKQRGIAEVGQSHSAQIDHRA